MKYMITWNERPQGTPIEYENAQKRILEVFSPWKAPANFKISWSPSPTPFRVELEAMAYRDRLKSK